MSTNPDLTEWRMQALERRLEEQDKEIEELKTKMNKREEDRQNEERARLKWGIATLGSVVMSLLGIIWTFREVILGRTP